MSPPAPSPVDAPRPTAKVLSNGVRRLEKLRESYAELGKLSQDLERKAFSVDGQVGEVRKALAGLEELQGTLRGLPAELEAHAAEAEQARRRARDRFGLELSRGLEGLGLEVSGRFPDLVAGPFALHLKPTRATVDLSLGSSGEALDSVAMDPEGVVKAITQQHELLFGGEFDAEAFKALCLKAVKRANRVAERAPDAAVPISEFLLELNVAAQSPGFAANPSRRGFHAVGRAEVSASLFRARPLSIEGHELRLAIATREQTRSVRDHLYVPTDLRGRGARFGGVQIVRSRGGAQ